MIRRTSSGVARNRHSSSVALVLASLATLVSLTALAPRAAAEGPQVEEHWYRVEIGGETAGWALDRKVRDAGELTSESVLHLRIRRGAEIAELEMESRFLETTDGRPLRAWSRQAMGALPVETTYVFTGGRVEVTVRQGDGEPLRQVQPLPAGSWLTPGRTDAQLRAALRDGATDIAIPTVDPLLGLTPTVVHWQRDGADTTIELAGRTYRASRWRQTQDFAPQLVTTVELDPQGVVLQSRSNVLGLEMVQTLATRDEVVDFEGSPELLVRSLIRPDRSIPEPRRLERAVYELRLPGGEPLDVPSAGAQRAERRGDAVRVSVDVGSRRTSPVPDREEFLRSSSYLRHDDPLLRELAGRALDGAGDDPAARAEAIRAFVHGYLTQKDLGTVMATASEVARSRSGDCTEHATLTAALLRAAGIPSRVAAGLVYVERFAGADDVFGYHMWTQAWIEDRWVDLDAISEARFDATHIAFGFSAMNDDAALLQDLASLVPLFGRLEIRVLELGPSEPRNARD